MDNSRKLASIRRISDIIEIPGADLIELAKVDGWQCVVAKEVGHKVNDLIVFYEIDSLLPEREEFEFLRKNCFVRNTVNGDGFRIKTIRLRKQISQGLVMPVVIVGEGNFALVANPEDPEFGNLFIEGDDVTEFLGVKKYERHSATLGGNAKGNFPHFIPKTDAERIQNCFRTFERYWKDHVFEATIKLDGTSFTAYFKREGDLAIAGEYAGQFGVCSRNLELLEDEGNLYWRMARKYDIESKLRSLPFSCAIQGEIIGPGVQGNKEGLTDNELYIFNIYNIDEWRYLSAQERGAVLGFSDTDCASNWGFKQVPYLDDFNGSVFNSVDDFLKIADGPSLKAKKREGVVLKSINDPNIQFKCISNEWLLDNGE